jgi:hypothetical protein
MLHKQIVFNKNFNGDTSAPSEEQDIVVHAIGTMVEEDKPTLVSLLQNNGVLITDANTKKELLDATFKAIRDSAKFRTDLQDYLTQVGNAVVTGQYENANFLNLNFFQKIGAGFKNVFKSKEGGSAVGNALRNNMDTIVGVGIGVIGAKLQNKANQGAGQQAIDYTNAQAQLEYIKGQNATAQQNAPAPPTTKTTPKWVLPVAIGGGVLILGTIIFFAVRKK